MFDAILAGMKAALEREFPLAHVHAVAALGVWRVGLMIPKRREPLTIFFTLSEEGFVFDATTQFHGGDEINLVIPYADPDSVERVIEVVRKVNTKW